MDVRMPDGSIIKNVPEGTTKAQLMAKLNKTAQPSIEEQRKNIAEGMTFQIGPFDTGIEMPQGLTETLAGAGKRLSEIGSLGTHKADPKTEALLNDSGYATAGGAGADLAAMLAGGSVLKGLGLIKAVPTLAETVAGGAAYGAATNEDRVSGGVAGGLGAGAGYGISSALGKVISPKVTEGAQDIITKGGVATPGEILGGSVKAVEDKATSIPVVGDMIKKAKLGTLQQWSKGVVNDAVKAMGKVNGKTPSLSKSSGAGHEAIKEAQEMISDRYDQILSKVTVSRDGVFDAEIRHLDGMVQYLPKKEAKQFRAILDRYVNNAFDKNSNMLLGPTFKETDSALRSAYKKLLKSDELAQNQLGDAVRTVHQSLLNMAKRQNKSLGKSLDKADVAYAKLSRIEDAARYAGAENGVFGPTHLMNAIKKSTSKKKFAVGEGFDQKAVQAAKDILPNKVPDSGTAGRAMIGAGALGLGGALHPGVAAGMLTGAGAYTKPGLKAMQAILTKRPKGSKETRALLEELAPLLGIGGASGAINVE